MDVTIILIVLGLMIVAMISGKFDLGFPPIAAVTVLAALNIVTIPQAFSGFTNPYLIITAAFLVISNAFSKTPVVSHIQRGVLALQRRTSGVVLFGALILAVIVLANLMQPGPAVLLTIVLLSTLPPAGPVTARQMLLPLGALSNLAQGKLPIGVALLGVVFVNGFLETAGLDSTVGIEHFLLIGLAPIIIAIVYMLLTYRFLPRGPIAAGEGAAEDETEGAPLSTFHQIVIYIVFLGVIAAVFFASALGDYLAVIPVIGVLVLLVTKAMSSQAVRSTLSMSIVFLLAGVFGLAQIMSDKGVGQALGTGLQALMGDAANGWTVVFVFAFATVLLANLTGSNYGTMFIMAPIAVTTAAAVGLDPRGIAIAVVFSALSSIILPLDTAIGITFASGRYKMSTLLLWTVPLTVVYIAAVCVSAMVVFPT
ncbi:SLC13 family permease [Microbacterium sp. NPDC089189]|uniref:SLC13 family permease n=1 Tax=Microbacterium sp. NPDC089189 TaxID=3154972 RepID=UPI00342E70D9